MTSKIQLQNKIQELEAELQSFKTQLSNYQELTLENAEPGDVLNDGTVVISKFNGLALLASPKETEVTCTWSSTFPEVFDKLQEKGFNPSQWFIPTIEQLKLAYTVASQDFASYFYWFSTEVSSTNACNLHFNGGFICSTSKTCTGCVRAFRCVTY